MQSDVDGFFLEKKTFFFLLRLLEAKRSERKRGREKESEGGRGGGRRGIRRVHLVLAMKVAR